MRFIPLIILLCLASCAPKRTPEQAIATALTYTELQWMPEERHIRHGKDLSGITVHTPDTTLSQHGDKRGWWKPGVPAKGMAYKWGGFDTPESFLHGLRDGKKAGDIANSYKIRLDNDAISKGSVGVDCSGFISRCWGLPKHYSTRDFPTISDPIAWDDMQPGDIILKKGHVLMYAGRQGGYIIGYESGPIPTWRVRRCAIHIDYLKKDGYSPWRYKYMTPPRPVEVEPKYEIDFLIDRW
jgi:cell wall-associated NlpC family hydrolase